MLRPCFFNNPVAQPMLVKEFDSVLRPRCAKEEERVLEEGKKKREEEKVSGKKKRCQETFYCFGTECFAGGTGGSCGGVVLVESVAAEPGGLAVVNGLG